MKAPANPRPLVFQATESHARRSPPYRVNKNLTLLLLLLALACFTCFGSAYYLFTTRWDFRPVSAPSSIANSTIKATASESAARLNEKYLSYLPHSGFHNQRIAFENALVLAYLLRRTLLVPPIRLGNKPIHYVEYTSLSRHHELSNREGLSHCPRLPRYLSRPPECLEYFEFSYVPWTWLVDLATIADRQTLFHRINMSQAWISDNFDILPSDIYTLRDDSPYQFRFLDTATDSSPLDHRYLEDVYIDKLRTVDQRLLQIGTLFGTSRLRLKKRDNIAYRALVRRMMIFTNKDLTDVADSIARSLEGAFLGVHLRSGDGPFKSNIDNTIQSVLWKILYDILGLSHMETCKLEESFGEEDLGLCNLKRMTVTNLKSSITAPPPFSFHPSSRLKCRWRRHLENRYHLLNIPLYIATDLENPDIHPLLSTFRKTFPCIFFLKDFAAETQSLEQLRSPHDGVDLRHFALPFVDALVLGRALKVVGTEGSTFSQFAEDVLWTSYHLQLPSD
jgi:hypothetical protein